ncbi:MAG TPA: sulfotransferase [Azonexus sp.]|nr:sulfotransferase [Azonexus sp.]
MINYMQMGMLAMRNRDFAAAGRWFEQAMAHSPEDPDARAWLGQALCNRGLRQQGIAHLQHAGGMLLQSARKDGKTGRLVEVAKQLLHWGEIAAATELLSELADDFGNFQTFQLLAAGYAQLNRVQDALIAAQRALEADPGNVMMKVFLGSLEADAGQFPAAKERLLAVLAGGTQPREAFRAHKELARIHDRLGEFDAVFPHLDAAGELATLLPEYAKQDKAFIPGMIQLNRNGFTRESMARWKNAEISTDLPAPVFIVGFLRSGTTLMQEVLDAHPAIFVADEADFISRVKRELHNLDKSGAKTPEKLANLDLDGVLHLRRFYWELVRARFGHDIDGRLFVDKFTMNTLDIGLINTIFPDAKVLFLVRDPRDVCLSCLLQLMVPTLMTTHIQTWTGTAEIYGQAMDWWFYIRDKLSLDLMEVRYEDVVVDFEGTFRRIFAFLGTKWDDGVTLFHERASKKFVATPSRSQVAQPLYASSVARWRHYACDVARVSQRLAPYVEKFGYPDDA